MWWGYRENKRPKQSGAHLSGIPVHKINYNSNFLLIVVSTEFCLQDRSVIQMLAASLEKPD